MYAHMRVFTHLYPLTEYPMLINRDSLFVHVFIFNF
nr:MAG TPA: hypothetical protein [Caudoviricetes sp.]